jgi:hypothetical protein
MSIGSLLQEALVNPVEKRFHQQDKRIDGLNIKLKRLLLYLTIIGALVLVNTVLLLIVLFTP